MTHVPVSTQLNTLSPFSSSPVNSQLDTSLRDYSARAQNSSRSDYLDSYEYSSPKTLNFDISSANIFSSENKRKRKKKRKVDGNNKRDKGSIESETSSINPLSDMNLELSNILKEYNANENSEKDSIMKQSARKEFVIVIENQNNSNKTNTEEQANNALIMNEEHSLSQSMKDIHFDNVTISEKENNSFLSELAEGNKSSAEWDECGTEIQRNINKNVNERENENVKPITVVENTQELKHVNRLGEIVLPLDNFEEDKSISHEPGMTLHPSGIRISEKAKSILRQWEQEKDKFFVSTLRKHSSKIFQLKSQLKRWKEKWQERLTIISQWMEWNKMCIINGDSGRSRANFLGETSSIVQTPTLSLKELDYLIQIWILEADITSSGYPTSDRSNLLLDLDEKLQFLQSRGYAKKDLVPSSLLNPSESNRYKIESKTHENNLELMMKEVFDDLIETDRIIIDKLENISNVEVEVARKIIIEKEIQTDSFDEVNSSNDEVECIEFSPSHNLSKIHHIDNVENVDNIDDDAQSQLSDIIHSRPNSAIRNKHSKMEYTSPTISRSSSRIDADAYVFREEVRNLKNVVESQQDEIDDLKLELHRCREKDDIKQTKIDNLKNELSKSALERRKLESSLQKMKKELEAAQLFKHKNSQLEQELKFAEYKIQREKNKAEDEARASKLQLEQINQSLNEASLIQQTLKNRISELEENIDVTSTKVSVDSERIVMQMEEMVSQIETNSVLKIQAGRRSRPSTRSGGRFVTPLRPSQNNDGSLAHENSISLSDFVDVPKLSQLMKTTMKQITDMNNILNIFKRDNDYLKKGNSRSNVSNEYILLNSEVHSENEHESTIQKTLDVKQERSHMDLTPRRVSQLHEGLQFRHTGSVSAQESALFAEENVHLKSNRRFSLRKNGTPIFPQRSQHSEIGLRRTTLPSIQPSIDSLQGVAFPRVDIKSSLPGSKLQRKMSENALHVVVPHTQNNHPEKIHLVKHQHLQSYLKLDV